MQQNTLTRSDGGDTASLAPGLVEDTIKTGRYGLAVVTIAGCALSLPRLSPLALHG